MEIKPEEVEGPKLWKEEDKEDEQFLKNVFCGGRDVILHSKAEETRGSRKYCIFQIITVWFKNAVSDISARQLFWMLPK